MQGALYGAKALATGTGPLMFAAMFAAFTKTDSPLPYFPGGACSANFPGPRYRHVIVQRFFDLLPELNLQHLPINEVPFPIE